MEGRPRFAWLVIFFNIIWVLPSYVSDLIIASEHLNEARWVITFFVGSPREIKRAQDGMRKRKTIKPRYDKQQRAITAIKPVYDSIPRSRYQSYAIIGNTSIPKFNTMH